MPEVDDRTLAKTFLRAGTLTPAQVEECAAAAADPHAAVTIIDVAIERGFLDRDEAEVARAQATDELAKTWALRHDAAVAKFIMRRQFVSREDVERCRKDQLARLKRGERVTLLDVLTETGCLSPQQVKVATATVDERGHRRLGDFEVIKKLGEGGMGAVYKARQISTNRIVALKVLPRYLAREPTVLKRFYREAQICATLQHPNIVQGLAVGDVEGRYYFAMEFVDGRSLREVIEQDGPMSVRDAMPIFISITTGLAYAHAHDLVHRDIKPENVILTREGVPKLADLGLAKDTRFNRSAITQSGITLGTAYYMPPEQARSAKHVDRRSDIYALGATFYHVLTGRVPYQGDSAFEVLSKHESAMLTPPRRINPDVPEALSAIIERMMQKKPADRFQSADDVLAALRAVPLPSAPPEGAHREGAPPLEAERPSKGPGSAAGELWYVWLAGPDGTPVVRQFDLPTLQGAIETSHIPLDAPVRRGSSGPYGRMDIHPHLRRALRERRVREKAIRRRRTRRQSRKVRPRDLDRSHAHDVRKRRIRAAVKWGLVVGLVVLVAWVLVALVRP